MPLGAEQVSDPPVGGTAPMGGTHALIHAPRAAPGRDGSVGHARLAALFVIPPTAERLEVGRVSDIT